MVGDVITDPDDVEDATISGNGTIDGAIYTRGEFRINGGGGADLNVNGGIWAGDQVRLNGNAKVAYNAEYMEAIKTLVGEGTPQICSWEDKKLPYLFQ